MDIALSIGLTALLILGNGYFAMSELAVISAKRSRLELDVEETGSPEAQRALQLQENSDSFLSTIQVAITLIGFGASAAATATLANPLAEAMNSLEWGWLTAISPVLSVVVVTLAVSYFTLVFGELVPKRIALANSEKVAKFVSGPVALFQKIVKPIVFLLSKSTNAVSKLFRIKTADDRQDVSEEEIKYLISDQDTLLDEEKRLIHEIFNLGDTIAREVMVPRVDMVMVEDTSTLAEVMEEMRSTGYSRVPVYHEDYDRIVGVAVFKDIIEPILNGDDDQLIKDYLRDTVFVPDTKDILPLLSEMQTAHQQIVIALDEHGGTAGLITIEDIVEEIVGEIEDEYDPDNKYLTKIRENEYLLDGRFPISDAIELGFPIEDTEEYETIAGWLMDIKDSLPHIGDVFEVEGYSFKVQSMRGRRLALIRVTTPLEEKNSEAAGEKQE